MQLKCGPAVEIIKVERANQQLRPNYTDSINFLSCYVLTDLPNNQPVVAFNLNQLSPEIRLTIKHCNDISKFRR
jgi:hypothetical protein